MGGRRGTPPRIARFRGRIPPRPSGTRPSSPESRGTPNDARPRDQDRMSHAGHRGAGRETQEFPRGWNANRFLSPKVVASLRVLCGKIFARSLKADPSTALGCRKIRVKRFPDHVDLELDDRFATRPSPFTSEGSVTGRGGHENAPGVGKREKPASRGRTNWVACEGRIRYSGGTWSRIRPGAVPPGRWGRFAPPTHPRPPCRSA